MTLSGVSERLSTATTRRAVVRSGTKLAYAAPLIAVSFQLRSLEATAQGVGSPTCQPDTCGVGGQCTPCRDALCGLLCTVERTIVCVDLTVPACESLDDCGGTADCGAGRVCVAGACCEGKPKCFPRGDAP